MTLIIKTFDSYAKFLSKVEKINLGFSEIQLEFIKNLKKKLSIKWWYEYLLLDLLLDKDEISIKELLKNGEKYFGLCPARKAHFYMFWDRNSNSFFVLDNGTRINAKYFDG